MIELITITWLVGLSAYLMNKCIDNLRGDGVFPDLNRTETVATIAAGILLSPLYLMFVLVVMIGGKDD